MRRARVDRNGDVRCWNCGSPMLLARSNERGRRTRHLRCQQCNEPQKVRQTKLSGVPHHD